MTTAIGSTKHENKYYKGKQLRNVITHGKTKKQQRKKQNRKNRSFLLKLIGSLSGNNLQNLYLYIMELDKRLFFN